MDFRSFSLGLLVCFLLSFVLGIERQFRKRALGLRTMILVSIGSYMFVSFSFMVTGYDLDVSRVASQVVAGIGFLGAGVIIKDNEKSKIRGLTTAATLWCDAAIGILCAGGFIKEAIVSSIAVLFANIVLRYVNAIVNTRVDDMKTQEKFFIKINSDNCNNVIEYLVNKYDHNEFTLSNYQINDDKLEIEIIIKKTNEKKIELLINSIINEFNIKKYSFKKVSEEMIHEESDEL